MANTLIINRMTTVQDVIAFVCFNIIVTNIKVLNQMPSQYLIKKL